MHSQSPSTGVQDPWVLALVQSLRKYTDDTWRLGEHDPVHLLGEVPGLGKSWIVGLAYEKRRGSGQTDVVFTSAIVAPYNAPPFGWTVMSAVSGDRVLSATIAVASHTLAGVWLTLGLFAGPEVVRARLALNDGKEVEPTIRDGGFMHVAEEDPLPVRIGVFGRAARLLETVGFPPETGAPPSAISSLNR